MLSNPILYRVLTQPFLYQWVLATVFPLLLWAILVKLARHYPGILPYALRWLKFFAWGLWFAEIACGLYCLIWHPGMSVFLMLQMLLFAVFGGINFMYHWVRRRVDPEAYVKKGDYGWWPTPKDSQEAGPGTNHS